jgi:HAD superfamily hydrolase (TIGR01549 family)
MISAVVFDIGETLLDDSRECGAWAAWLGVPLHTLSALIGAVTALGNTDHDAYRLIRPGIDIQAERRAREAAGRGQIIEEPDLYPDVRPALAALRDRGIWVGVAGNQPRQVGELLRGLKLPADAVAVSEDWGVAKPSPAFFARVQEWAGRPARDILYVGDHRDNDIVPAKLAGMRTAVIRRGPFGYLWCDDPLTVRYGDWRLESLTELPGLIC